MSDRQARIAHNEALFRQLNERIAEILDEIHDTAARFEIICECGNSACDTKIGVGKEDYEEVRQHAERFLVARGHVFPEVEDVIRSGDGFEVVEKHLEEAVIARATDPRAS